MKTKLLRTFVALLLTTLATVTAWAADTEAPTISNKTITMIGTDYHSISISWEKATDNLTQQKDLVYEVLYRKAYSGKEFQTVFRCQDIKSYTFTDLLLGQEYEIIVKVRDNAQNYASYETLFAKPKADTEAPTLANKNVTASFGRGLADWARESEHTNQIKITFSPASDNVTYDNHIIYNFYNKKANESAYQVADCDFYRQPDNSVYGLLYDFEPGTYDILVEAQDWAGKRAQNNPVRVTVSELSSPPNYS